MDAPAGDGIGRRIILFAAAATFLLFAFMASAVNIALPRLGEELSLDAIMLGWVATGYLLSSAALLVPAGRIADIYGRKKIFATGIAIFTLASLLSGVATSGVMLISFRVLQGIGVAMFVGTGVALLISVFPAAERGKVLGMIVAAVFTGLTLGPVLGGVLTQHLGWRSIFFLTVPLGLVVLALVMWKLKGEWTGAKGEKFDLAGSLVYIVALVALVLGLTFLPGMLGVWLVVGGVVGLFTFVRWEMRIRSPILDMNLFRNSRAFTFSSVAMLLGFVPFWAVTLLINLYLQYVKGLNPESAGLVLVAMPVMSAVLSPLAGKFSDRIEPRIIASTGMALITLGLVMFVFLTEGTSLQSVIVSLILVGSGFALFDSPNTNAVMSSAPKTAYGVASATAATMRQIGMVLGMGIVMLMFALYIGRVEITPEYYARFQESMRTSFVILAVLCSGGVLVSLARGKVR
ncbi:MAG: MFS transporter [Dehalococcoidia bacterium]